MSVTLYAARDHYGTRGVSVQLGLYPDNSPVIDLEEAWNTTGPNFKSILVRPADMQEFFTAMMIVDSIRERGGTVDSLILPCIPGQRQDRLKWEGDWLLTLKYVAKTINSMNFEKVISLDPHSLAAEVLINRLVVPGLKLRHLIEDSWDKRGQKAPTYSGIIAPDLGAAKRAEAAAKHFEIPVFYGRKHRDPATNKLSGFSVDGLPDWGHYLVVDDLCDAGGTFLGLAESLPAGVTADLFVTHGLFTKGTEKLTAAYGNLYTTDSVDRLAERVHYFNVSEGLNLYA
jgi:ribose-phosphate pyrophosphokinase